MNQLIKWLATVFIAIPVCLQAQTVAIVGATIIDGNGGKPIENGVILIEGKRVAAVGDRRLTIPAAAARIDARGKYVIPGLMDANVHLLLDFWPYTISRYEGRYDELVTEAAQIALRSGVTTVFDSWGPRVDVAKVRDDINAGNNVGSRVFLAGNIVGLGGPYSRDFLGEMQSAFFEPFIERTNARWQENVGPELLWMSPEQVREQVRSYLGKGVDFLKYAVNGHNSEEMQYIAFSPRVQQVMVEEAHRAGVTVQTHTTSDEGVYLAMQAGVDLLQHCNLTGGSAPMPAALVRTIVQRQIPCALLAYTESALAWYRAHGAMDQLSRLIENGDANARALIAAGAQVLLSTDAGVFSEDMRNSGYWKQSQPPQENLMLLGEGHWHWLLAMEQKGMKPMDALLAATRNIARAYKVDRDLGTLEPGKLADLLILDRNPLEAAAHYRGISLIMKEGSVIDRSSLPRKRLLSSGP